MSDLNPLSPAGDGASMERDARTGRFAAGNQVGKGNPFAKRVAALRSALHDA